MSSVTLNIGNDWFRLSAKRNWSITNYNANNKIGYRVTASDGSEYIYYPDSNNQASETNKLRQETTPSGKVITYHYLYGDNSDLLGYKRDQLGNETQFTYLDKKLVAISLHKKVGSSLSMVRSVALKHDDTKKLIESNCADCGGASTKYEFANSKMQLYDKTIARNVPAKRLLTKVTAMDGSDVVVKTYTYFGREEGVHCQDEFKSYCLGEDIKVNEWKYEDSEDPSKDGITDCMWRRDYVDNDTCRIKEYTYTNGTITSVKEYHGLFTGSVMPSGNYSETTYVRNANSYITTYPNGSQMVIEYDTNSQPQSRKRRAVGMTDLYLGGSTYSLTGSGSNQKYRLTASKNRSQAVTTYEYTSEGKRRRTYGPSVSVYPDLGSSAQAPHRTDGRVKYDSKGRVEFTYQLNASGLWVGTHQKYNSDNGKVAFSISGLRFNADGTVITSSYANARVTGYFYDAFNQLVEVAKLSGYNHSNNSFTGKSSIRRTYYTVKGVKSGDSVLLDNISDPNLPNVISATKYTHDAFGRLTVKSVVKTDTTFLESALQSDIALDITAGDPNNPNVETKIYLKSGDSFNLPWVHTVYEYDTYGRRTAVIEDAKVNGETTSIRKGLKTEYTYNNQSEIIMVKYPTGRVVKTFREGRGLTSEVKVGYMDGVNFVMKSFTKFKYDVNGNLVNKLEPHPDGAANSYVKTVNEYDKFDRLLRTYKQETSSAVLD